MLALLDEGFERKAWHGPNLRGALRGVSATAALIRPRPGRHSIREIALHCAYWKYAVYRLLAGAPRGSFPLEGHNWFPQGTRLSEAAWRNDRALLLAEHRRLRDEVSRLSPQKLRVKPPGTRFTLAELIRGAACHDIYHAGQIQFLKRLSSARVTASSPVGRRSPATT